MAKIYRSEKKRESKKKAIPCPFLGGLPYHHDFGLDVRHWPWFPSIIWALFISASICSPSTWKEGSWSTTWGCAACWSWRPPLCWSPPSCTGSSTGSCTRHPACIRQIVSSDSQVTSCWLSCNVSLFTLYLAISLSFSKTYTHTLHTHKHTNLYCAGLRCSVA